MHVVFFNRSYHPDPEASGQNLTELAEDLVAKGEQVSVVCGRSYHVKGRWGFHVLKIQMRNGVRIIRVFNTQLPKSSFALRLINLGTYLADCLFALFFLRRPDVVVSQTDPPLLPLLAGSYARLVGARFVFSVKDVYPDLAVELGEISNPIWLKLLQFATRFGLRHADLVTVLGEDMKEKVLRKGCAPEKIRIARDWADTERIRPRKKANQFRRRHGFAREDFIVMYSGNLGLSQRLESLLHVARRLQGLQNVRFVIVGEGAAKGKLQGMAAKLRLDSEVLFLPYQPKESLGESLSAADLHLIPLAEGTAGFIVPCKVYSIMASGTPYLAVMDRESDVVRIANEHECGMWCSPGSGEKLEQSIRRAYENRESLRAMGRNGRRAVLEQFSRRISTDRVHRILNSLVQEAP